MLMVPELFSCRERIRTTRGALALSCPPGMTSNDPGPANVPPVQVNDEPTVTGSLLVKIPLASVYPPALIVPPPSTRRNVPPVWSTIALGEAMLKLLRVMSESVETVYGEPDAA